MTNEEVVRMRQEVPTWLAVIVILGVLIVAGAVYWFLSSKPQSGVGGQPVTVTAPPPGVPGAGTMRPATPEKGK